jgi:UDP-glucose 4-epimerase
LKVIVFGGSGFLGSHVADELTKRGHQVKIFDINASPYLQPSQEMVIGSILDREKITKAIEGCEIVYNFAGLADMDEAMKKPIETVQLNVLGNVNILEAAKINKVKRFIFASSAYVFSKFGGFYSASKLSSERFIEAYQESCGLNFTILRYGSLYGRRADFKNPIFRMINNALKNKKLSYKGTGEEIREYIHVYDAANLSVDILADEYVNRHLILTGIEKLKVKDLIYMIKEILDSDIEIDFEQDKELGHYRVTPYSFHPTIGNKVVKTDYVDLGQGLLDTIQEISEIQQREENL